MAAGSAQSSKSRARRKRRHLRRPRDQVQTVRLYPVVPAEQVGDHTGRGEAQSARAAAACPLKGAKTRFRWREVAALQERASFGTPHDRPVTRRERFRPVAGARLALGLPALSGFSALATRMMQRQMEKLSGGYFPRAVFFFGFGFGFGLPVLPGAASFFGRFGDTCSSFLGWQYFGACAFRFGRRLPVAQQGDLPPNTDQQAHPARARSHRVPGRRRRL
jgi:hypothetical protein